MQWSGGSRDDGPPIGAAVRERRQPSPPGDSAAGTARRALRAAVGRSSGSWARRRKPPPGPPLPRTGVVPVLCGGVVPNYRCGAAPDWPILIGVASPASLFIRRVATAGTDEHNISRARDLSTPNIVAGS